jgi:glyoxylase I family protein
MLQKLHHVAYRCTNAAQTVDFYTRLLGLELVHALTNDYVPSVKRYDPHLHIFFAMEDGSYIAFFEVPMAAPAQKDPNTPAWVQHLALEVKDMGTLLAGKQRLEKAGVEVIGPTDHADRVKTRPDHLRDRRHIHGEGCLPLLQLSGIYPLGR